MVVEYSFGFPQNKGKCSNCSQMFSFRIRMRSGDKNIIIFHCVSRKEEIKNEQNNLSFKSVTDTF